MAHLSDIEIQKRIYTDDLFKERQIGLCSHDYYRFETRQTEVITDGIVLPLQKHLNEKGESGFKGGITDKDGKFYQSSAHVHFLGNQVGSLTDGYSVQEAEIDLKDDTVIYGGILFHHFGHFLTESVSRLWYFCEHKDEKTPIVFLARKDRKPSPQVYEFLELLGIPRKRIIVINKPTRFSKIIVPDATSVFCGYYSDKFMLPYRTVADAVIPRNDEKIYLSRRKFKKGITIYGEDRLEKAFKANGFKVIYPERLSLREQIAYIKGAKEIACVMGTAAHLCLFAKENTKMIVLERTEHINTEQILISQAAQTDWYSISANMNYLPVDNEFSPILMGITEHVAAFFQENGYRFDETDVNRIADRHLRKFNKSWLSRYSSARYNDRIAGSLPVYSKRIGLYCKTAFLSLRQRLFLRRTDGLFRLYTVFGFSFKIKRRPK